jgi:signal transduction histidine kinase
MVADQFSIAIDRSDSVSRAMIANHTLMEKASQLKEALRKEQEMRKMQNEFVALVSHEFKTPLQIIDSTRELLGRKLKSYNLADESIDKALERIKSGIQRMNGLIHSTLNLARMENAEGKITLQPEIFDLRKFISDIIEKNSNLALNKNIEVVVRIDELPTQFNGDPKLLDHSIVNIISNAIKYSRANSLVKIFAKANDKKVALRVIDQGIGIPKEDLQSVGQKFFRAKNTLSVAGTGIGLYLTKHFIELHGGEVLIESEIDVGTSVTVILPRTLPNQI